MLFMLLTTCASALEVLSGRAPVRTLIPGVPQGWRGCETAELGESMLTLEPATLDRLAAGAAAIGAAFARAVACATVWIRLVRAAELRAAPERLASVGCWPMLFLADRTSGVSRNCDAGSCGSTLLRSGRFTRPHRRASMRAR